MVIALNKNMFVLNVKRRSKGARINVFLILNLKLFEHIM